MKIRMLALILALMMPLSLAACSAPAADPSDSPAPSQSAAPSASQEPAIVADLDQDILTFAAGDLAKETGLLTVNGEQLSTSLYLYWLAFGCSYFESSYAMYGLTVADYAEAILNDTNTMAAYYAILKQQTMAQGCPLTDDQLAAINTEMEVGGETHEERKILYGLSEEDLMFIYSVTDYYDNLMNTLVPVPTTEQLNNYVYQAKHILIKTVDTDGQATLQEDGSYAFPSLDEDTVAQQTALANDILAQLQAAKPEELEELFDQLMHQYSEDGRDAEGNLAAPDGYTTTVGQMVAEFDAGALALEPGQISGLVESMYGYHIILRGEVEDIDSYADGYRQAQMDTQLNTWLTEAEILPGEALEGLDVAQFYDRYLAWQEAWIAANPADSE